MTKPFPVVSVGTKKVGDAVVAVVLAWKGTAKGWKPVWVGPAYPWKHALAAVAEAEVAAVTAGWVLPSLNVPPMKLADLEAA